MSQITIVPPDPSWPSQFESIRQNLEAVLGERALRVDHIGSTSVPGLPAKDVIDVQVTVASIKDARLIALMTDAGYDHRAGVTFDNLVGYEAGAAALEKRFFRHRPAERAAHIHIRESGRLNQRYPLLFRDFLKADAQMRQAYALVKQELAARFPNDSNAYYAIKDPYMDTLYRAACLWADQVGWHPE